MADTPQAYSNSIRKFTDIAGLRVDVVMRKLTFDGLAGIFRRSPVDTGRFRASWRVSLGAADLTVEPEDFDSGGVATKGGGVQGRALQQVKALRFGSQISRDQIIVLSNNLPYAEELERGSSDQAPAGVVAPTFVELQSGLDRAIAAAKREAPDAR